MRRIKLARPVAWLAAIGTAGIMATLIVIQSQTILQMRQEISSLRAEIEQLGQQTRNTEAVANARVETDAPKANREDPSQELLRLRGEVGVLRQQITGLQGFPDSVSAEKLRYLKAFRMDMQKDSMRLEVISNRLNDAKVSPADRAQTILSAGFTDVVLDELVEKLFIAEQRHQRLARERGDTDGDVQDSGKWIDDLNDKLDKRCRGFLMGLEQRVLGMKEAVEKLEVELQQSATGSR